MCETWAEMEATSQDATILPRCKIPFRPRISPVPFALNQAEGRGHRGAAVVSARA